MENNLVDEEKVVSSYRNISNHPAPYVLDGYDTGEGIIKDQGAYETVSSIVKHKKSVCDKLNFLANEISKRAEVHDNTKLEEPEIGWLIAMDKEGRKPYGSPEYFEKLKRWQKFFDHHYKHNRHHPDHFTNGVNDMSLVDLCEYLMDIISYYDEMHVKDAVKTVEEQGFRFGLDEQLKQILKNTLLEYFTWFGDSSPKFKPS